MDTYIAIVGSRGFKDYALLCASVDEYIKSLEPYDVNVTIVSGGAAGADTLAERYADENNCKKLIFLAEWKKYGRAAGIVRNKDIINAADTVIAFWDGKSKGTNNSIDLAKKAKIQSIVIMYSGNKSDLEQL